MKLNAALEAAEIAKGDLVPYCDRIEIAGSIRRRKEDVGDIEIVAIPKRVEVGLFGDDTEREPGFARVVNQWGKVKGDPQHGLYTQRILPVGIKLDLFVATPLNWGLIYAIRTGSADFSRYVLASGWVRSGYRSINGMLHTIETGEPWPTPEEEDLFRAAGVAWIEPEKRI